MAKHSNKRFLAIAVPLLTLLVAAAAVMLCFAPQIRLAIAQKAYDAGNYQAAMDMLGEDNDESAALLKADCKYMIAQQLYQSGDYAAARDAFLTIRQHKDAQERATECLYSAAIEQLEGGDYEGAYAAFLTFNGYRDSLAYLERCKMLEAEQTLLSGDYVKAIQLFLSIGSEPAVLRAEQVAMERTEQTDPQKAIDMALGYTEEEIEQMNRAKKMLENMPVGILATGFRHTVGIAEDGTVVACGDNTSEQCAVDGWREAAAVAAGAEHTVALRKDGTVVACGDNTYGQCDVSEWTDVKSIAAGNYDTFALTNGGKLLHTGFHEYSGISDWSNISKISAGGHVFAVLLSSGRMLATHPSSNASELSGLSDIAVQTGFAVGLNKDGRLLGHGIELPELTGIIAIAAAPNRILALCNDTTVFEYPFQERDRLLTEPQSQIVCLANSATHIALLREDGTVHCFGSNDFGQCNTEQWVLRTAKVD